MQTNLKFIQLLNLITLKMSENLNLKLKSKGNIKSQVQNRVYSVCRPKTFTLMVNIWTQIDHFSVLAVK